MLGFRTRPVIVTQSVEYGSRMDAVGTKDRVYQQILQALSRTAS